MKYKIIASVVIILLIILVAVIKFSGNSQQFDENGNPIQTEEVQQ
jgi:hypothetical protein